MGVTTNGFPKSGNHALVKAVELLGEPCSVNHLPYGSQVDSKHVFVKRDPRNVICSWLRYYGKPVTPGMFITSFRQFQAKSLVDEMGEFEGWLSDPGTLLVEYEDLIVSDAEMRRIAAFIGTPYYEGAFEELPGLTRTWFAEHSDYRTIWTPDVETIFADEGGNDLLVRWGYSPWKS